MWVYNLFQAVENDLKIAAKARKDVENQAQRMLAQGMETQVTWSRCPFQLLKSMKLPHPPVQWTLFPYCKDLNFLHYILNHLEPRLIVVVDNSPFYSCGLGILAFEGTWGWSWPCFDTTLLPFLMEILLKNNYLA